MKAVIYCRHSPQRNGENSMSCDTQEAYCEEYAAKKGWEIGAIYRDEEWSGADE